MEIINLLFNIISVTIAFVALLISITQLGTDIYPKIIEWINKIILNKKFSMGPYDKATIERSTEHYIRPKCSNIDPAQEQEPRNALVAVKEDLFKVIDNFILSDTSKRHLLILADSGMGKTSLVLNYYAYNARRFVKRQKISLVPLGIKNAEDWIDKIPDQENVVIFLDALDEDVKALSDHKDRIAFLMQKCSQFKKIIITCRTQFFPKSEEIPVETGILRLGPRHAGDKGSYEFWKLYLLPFSNDDVKKYIYKRYRFWEISKRKKALDIALGKIPLLTVRPMLLAHIPDVIGSQININYSFQLYEIMIEAWLEREAYWVDKEKLRKFSEKLALDIYLNREIRGNEGVSYEDLKKLAGKWNVDLDDWQLSGRSLLNRDANNNFKFAHRSIMEYLTVKVLILDGNAHNGILLTDQMKVFLSERLIGDNFEKVSYRLDAPHSLNLDILHVLNALDDDTLFTFRRVKATDILVMKTEPLWVAKFRGFLSNSKTTEIIDEKKLVELLKIITEDDNFRFAKTDLKIHLEFSKVRMRMNLLRYSGQLAYEEIVYVLQNILDFAVLNSYKEIRDLQGIIYIKQKEIFKLLYIEIFNQQCDGVKLTLTENNEKTLAFVFSNEIEKSFI
ncbi:MAG: hypothetical protein H7Y59_05950 [Anaerolineales bacterium]|nr:hypothetical protein [Anaerolineales bacterium]